MSQQDTGSMYGQPPYYYMPKRKTRWWIPLIIIGIILLLLVVGVFVVVGVFGAFLSKEPYEVRQNSVLMIDLGQEVKEYVPADAFSFLSSSSRVCFWNTITSIRKAREDDYIKGIYLRVTPTQMGWAMSEEFIEELDKFKASGKFIYAYIETGSELDYFRALPADKIFMSSESMMELNGFGVSSMFLKGLLSKIGVEFYVKGFEDFKSAGESYSRKNFSDSSRYQLKVLLDQRNDVFIKEVSRRRKIDPDDLRNAMDRGTYTTDALLALGLIDTIATEVDIKEIIRDLAYANSPVRDHSQQKLRLVSLGNYISSRNYSKERKVNKENQIAIIFASGTIVDSKPDNVFQAGENITPKRMINYLRKARDDDKVKAIILRIDSPGGSVVASDAIYEEILKTRQVKPVYASMGDVAASGGYYMAVACDKIIAEPTTITGSIGVIAAVPNFSKLLKNFDVGLDTISTGPSAQDLNFFQPFNEKWMQKLDGLLEGVYYRFITKVAKHRKKTFDEIRAIAKGRVWTGEDAHRIGLVDSLGGLGKTIAIVKSQLGVGESERIRLRYYPEETSGVEFLMNFLGRGNDDNDENINIQGFGSEVAKSLNADMNSYKVFLEMLPPGLRNQAIGTLQMLLTSQKEPMLMTMPYIYTIE